jgi:hypothetical protein
VDVWCCRKPIGGPPCRPGERRGLSRHWRNACTYGGHDPTAGKFHRVDTYLLTCTPPDHGQI